jgi:hypothetical protein
MRNYDGRPLSTEEQQILKSLSQEELLELLVGILRATLVKLPFDTLLGMANASCEEIFADHPDVLAQWWSERRQNWRNN